MGGASAEEYQRVNVTQTLELAKTQRRVEQDTLSLWANNKSVWRRDR